jgi:hypothetical protein
MTVWTILVDDSDNKRITYDGSWNTSGDEHEHNSTTHYSDSEQATLSFPFNGTSVAVYGTIPSDSSHGHFSCQVEGNSSNATIPSYDPIGKDEKHRLFCGISSLSPDSEHTLTIQADASITRFILDYFTYTYEDGGDSQERKLSPAPDGSPIDVMIDDTELGRITYEPSSAWTLEGAGVEFRGSSHRVQTTGATTTFQFTGSVLTVYGTTPKSTNTSQPQATLQFSLDGQVSDSFTSAPNVYVSRHTPFFRTMSQLQNDAQHNVVITYTSKDTMPIWFDYIVYRPNTQLLTSGDVEDSTPTQIRDSAHRPINVGLIVGVCIAGVVLLLSALTCLVLRKRRQRNSHNVSDSHPGLLSPFPWGHTRLPIWKRKTAALPHREICHPYPIVSPWADRTSHTMGTTHYGRSFTPPPPFESVVGQGPRGRQQSGDIPVSRYHELIPGTDSLETISASGEGRGAVQLLEASVAKDAQRVNK